MRGKQNKNPAKEKDPSETQSYRKLTKESCSETSRSANGGIHKNTTPQSLEG